MLARFFDWISKGDPQGVLCIGQCAKNTWQPNRSDCQVSRIFSLFHGDALCQVAGLIDVASLHQSHIIAENLQRDNRQGRQ
ncbi:hypothetical protein BN3661_01597 [Eubacteriaceae bacterium CHKCI005]|nr:hypothetical protein BN3661_01597 [Eubacteriaceae bacterium CHKCI005]